MEFKKKELSNGLTLIGELKPAAKSAAVGFFVKTGSRDEGQQINGVSHFLEHMVFKGTERLSALQVNAAFDRTGAQFNAFTSEECTVFYAAVLPEYLLEVTRLWTKLMRPALREEDFNIEKNVIKEEIAMYKDLPSFDVMDRCRRLHFDGHPCGNSVLGSEQIIEALTAGQMRGYFAERYAPNNMVLAAVGNLDWQRLCDLAEKACQSWARHPAARQVRPCAGSGAKKHIGKENLVREHICLMSSGISAQDPGRFAASLLAMIVGDEVGSRFFWELVDKALAETASMHHEAMDGTGAFCTYLRCGRDNVGQVLDVVDGILQDIAKQGVTSEELRKAKNKVLSALVIKNEVPMGRLVDLGFNWLYLRDYRSVRADVEAIKAVTVEDIGSLIADCKPGKFTQFSMGPVGK